MNLPHYNEFHNMAIRSSHNEDVHRKASHIWRTQNATRKKMISYLYKENDNIQLFNDNEQ